MRATLDFGKGDGLIPAVVQHAETGAVLMVGYMNAEALAETFQRRKVVFFSRSKQRLWMKGETSGHVLDLVEVRTDCDRDSLLVTRSTERAGVSRWNVHLLRRHGAGVKARQPWGAWRS